MVRAANGDGNPGRVTRFRRLFERSLRFAARPELQVPVQGKELGLRSLLLDDFESTIGGFVWNLFFTLKAL